MISVALCTYNGHTFLRPQLSSIFSQTHPVDEIVICDDGSTDETVHIIDYFKRTYPGIIELHTNDRKLGVVKNFEKAVKLCRGDVIFLSDQDDVWRNDKVQKVMNFFGENPQSFAVFSDARLIDETSKDIGKTLWEIHQFKEAVIHNPTLNLYHYLICHSNAVTGACLAITKQAIPIVTPFKEIEEMYHDEWIALQLSPLNRINYLNDTLISYRLHSTQQTKLIRYIEREELNLIKRRIILGETDVDGIEHYRYWKRRWNTLQKYISAGLAIDRNFLDEITSGRKNGLIKYYKTLNIFERKRVLFRNWIKREENITFLDVVVS
jgi:glycosyltransferase involved in cell wall biosynthesis